MNEMMNDDMALVRDYVVSQSEPAFATLVARHIGLVHSVALRHVGDPHLAQDVTQAVFIILAHKAGSLGTDTILSAWLYRTACYVAAETRRTRHRREQREQEADMQSTLNDPQAGAWEQLSPLLDEAMAGLSEPQPPLGLWTSDRVFPRQPSWALSRNPFGILAGNIRLTKNDVPGVLRLPDKTDGRQIVATTV